MADELPPAPSESEDDAKSETIRITLPAKPETPTAKRETVRINLPGKLPSTGITPKKETTKIVTETGENPTVAAPPAAAPSGAKPFVPPPPKPPSGVGAPPPPAKPVSGLAVPPKPPGLSKPTVPLKPGAPPVGVKPGAPSGVRPPGAPAAAGATDPLTQKAAAPKKETARITLPPEGSKAGGLPKATVKMQQTQPLVRQPSASTIQAAPMIQTSPASATNLSSGPVSDGLMNVLAIMAFIVAIGAAVLAYLAFETSKLT